MTSIAQISQNEQREIEGTLKKFFADYGIRSLLKACRAEKQKGQVPETCCSEAQERGKAGRSDQTDPDSGKADAA